MRALITGITGFVGSHLGEHLRAEGDAVFGVRRDPSPANTLVDSLRKVPLVEWDVAAGLPEAAVLRQIEDFVPDVLFHLAAVSIPRECGSDEPTPEARRVNVGSLEYVFALAKALPWRPRIVFTSSSHVYAPVDPRSPVVAETATLGPRNAYGRTKLAAEELCHEAHRRDGLDVLIVRSFSQSGPRQDGRLMLSEWTQQFLRGGTGSMEMGPIEVVSLDVTLDFLDVRDAVRALRAVALHGSSGATQNIGSGVARTTGEIFELLRAASGDRRPVVETRPGRRSDPVADIGRLQAATGWSPRIPPEVTVADVLADWRRRLSAS